MARHLRNVHPEVMANIRGNPRIHEIPVGHPVISWERVVHVWSEIVVRD
jgi:hypothetical protein